MKKIWIAISENGIKPNFQFEEKKRIRLINKFSIISFAIAFFYTILLFALNMPYLAILDLFIVIISIIVFLLVRLRQIKSALAIITIFIPLSLVLISSAYGRVGSEYYLFSLMTLLYFIIKNRILMIFIIIYLMICFFVSKYFEQIIIPVGLTGVLAYYFFYITVVSSFITVSIFLYIFSKENEKKRKELENYNKELEYAKNEAIKKSSEIEILMKELSHRTKNNLQLVSSLVYNQASKIKEPNAKKTLIDVYNRIVSIAILHKKLYTTDKFYSVSINEYVEDLLIHLQDIFQDNENPIEIIKKIEIFDLKIDNALSLGLVINELLTNSFKHGTENSKQKFIKFEIFKNNTNEVEIKIADSGNQIKNYTDCILSQTFGIELIKSLVKKMKGHIFFETNENINYIRVTFKIINQ